MNTELLPQDTDVEMAVIGAMLVDPDCIPDVIARLQPIHFYLEKHRRIFEVIRHLDNINIGVDVLTVSDRLREEDRLKEIGGAHYLAICATASLSSANVTEHINIIVDKHISRQAITKLTGIIKTAYTQPSEETVSEIAITLTDIERESMDQLEVINTDKAFKRLVDNISWYADNKGKHIGVSLGYRSIEDIIPSVEPGQVMLLAARPSVGKTAFACNVTRYASFNSQKVGWILLESTPDALTMRMACQQAQIDNKKIKSGNLSEDDWGEISTAISKLNIDNFFIAQDAGCTLELLRSRIQELIRKHSCQLIIIDYIQLITGKAENRNREIEQVIATIKELAIKYMVPIMALSQLSRETEKRMDKRPILSDLRDSGSLEQVADIVAFLHRENTYIHPNSREYGLDGFSTAEFIVRKNRDGAVGVVELKFHEQYGVFED